MPTVEVLNTQNQVVVTQTGVDIISVGVQGPAGAGPLAGGTNDGDVTTWDTTTSTWRPNATVNISDGGTISFDQEVVVSGTSIDWTDGQKQAISPTGATTYTFVDPAGPCNLTLKITDPASNIPTLPVIYPNGNATPQWTTGTDLLSIYFDGSVYRASHWGS